jgi:hypothetical protein
MISSPAELEEARNQALRLEQIIQGLRSELAGRDELFDEMVGAYATRLRQLRFDIDAYLGVRMPKDADLVLRVDSPDINLEGAPSTILVDALERLRKAIANSFMRISAGEAKGPGRPTDELRIMSEPRVLWLAPGSLRIGVDLPASYHRQTMESWAPGAPETLPESPIKRSVSLLLAAAAWAASTQPVEAIEVAIPEAAVRKVILEQVRQLSPTPKGRISSIAIEGDRSLVESPIVLTNVSRSRAREGAYPDSGTKEFEDTGVLRRVAVDLDKDEHFFELRDRPNRAQPIKGDFPEELRARVFDAIHRQYRVHVRGILETKVGQQAKSVLHLEDFERL